MPGTSSQTKRQVPGKRVGGFLYIHRTAVGLLDPADASAIADAAGLIENGSWNVAKIKGSDLSLLLYEEFDDVAFPVLLTSWKIDRTSRTAALRDYRGRANPPILHRKEALLRFDDPRIPRFTALTRQAEDFGLFSDTKTIGTRARWEELIRKHGLLLHGHTLVRKEETVVDVERHRTAIVRRDLSQPVALMRRLGIIDQNSSTFDYGCGQGDDVAALIENGYDAFGWDPHFAPNGLRRAADAVNLGFVVNVIEDPNERVETVRAAWFFAKKALVVSAMLTGKAPVSGLKPYKDGFLTSRGTFQKYFTQEELRALVSTATGLNALSLGAGIVAAFRDKELEQEVNYRRRSKASILSERFRVPRRLDQSNPEFTIGSPIASERIAVELEAIWRTALNLGRMPIAGELPPDIRSGLLGARVAVDRALAICLETFDRASLGQAAEARREDLLVHFALTLFPGAPRYSTLPRSIQRDVKTFFGSHTTAMQYARNALFEVGEPGMVNRAACQAADKGIGSFDSAYRFQMESLSRTPSPIRIIVGCAEVIEPDVGTADFVEIDAPLGIVRTIRCSDPNRTMPLVVEVIEVDLKALKRKRIRPKDRILYLKARYMTADDPAHAEQTSVDAKLLRAGLVSSAGDGPDALSLARLLLSASPL
ncbi:hypothetical protein DK26_06880 [Bosea sp. WAO]|uniref:DNA phosphorothioation-associated putative methyltransferase n=1 Tax=Bosea sp. WAO TaxID=406341 RepID=UPI00074AAFD9|nr:DNA phosphorothioation-associated putative methyltransferase [Bosea sp. WAO]KUL96505.1 hypothetical protein DK26_06880 [Bosea sp. WAO]